MKDELEELDKIALGLCAGGDNFLRRIEAASDRFWERIERRDRRPPPREPPIRAPFVPVCPWCLSALAMGEVESVDDESENRVVLVRTLRFRCDGCEGEIVATHRRPTSRIVMAKENGFPPGARVRHRSGEIAEVVGPASVPGATAVRWPDAHPETGVTAVRNEELELVRDEGGTL